MTSSNTQSKEPLPLSSPVKKTNSTKQDTSKGTGKQSTPKAESPKRAKSRSFNITVNTLDYNKQKPSGSPKRNSPLRSSLIKPLECPLATPSPQKTDKEKGKSAGGAKDMTTLYLEY